MEEPAEVGEAIPGDRAAVSGASLPTEEKDRSAFPAVAAADRPVSRLLPWLQRQAGKRYWLVLLTGLAAFLAATAALNRTENSHLVPLVLILGSAVVPVTFVRFCYEEGAFAGIPSSTVAITFVSGAVLGILIAALLEPAFVTGTGFGAAVGVAACEEAAKVAAVIWFLRDRRLDRELDGLVLGAAAGMGFAALETAGYGFDRFLDGWTYAGPVAGPLVELKTGVDAMTQVLLLRMLLALFGHGVWSAIVCAAIWRERRAWIIRPTPGVFLAFSLAVLLHAMWDTSPILWPIVAVIGLRALQFFLNEARDQGRGESAGSPLPPLGPALWNHLWQRRIYRPGYLPTVMGNALLPPPDGALGRVCTRCGLEVTAVASYCGNCGTRLS